MLGTALFLFAVGAATCQEHLNETIAATLERITELFESGQYEELAAVVGIENVDLIRPRERDSAEENPMFNKDLEQGDIFLTLQQAEQARQGLSFDKYPNSRWNGTIPYYIPNTFSNESIAAIEDAIAFWNIKVDCIKWIPFDNHNDVVLFLPFFGCWSHLGRTGGLQLISLQEPWCISRGTILHEMNHASGFTHEHSRLDRDHYIRILWDNIPEELRPQYSKNLPYMFRMQTGYDYYSIMHYPVTAPGTGLPAYEILVPGIDERFVGRANEFTCTDLEKIHILHCK